MSFKKDLHIYLYVVVCASCVTFASTHQQLEDETIDRLQASEIVISPPSGQGPPNKEDRPLIDEDVVYEEAQPIPPDVLSEEDEARMSLRARETDTEVLESDRLMNFQQWRQETEKSLGLLPSDSSSSSNPPPSYTMTLDKIYELYRQKRYARALVLVNEMLNIYPNSVQFLLMKGTLHQKLNQLELAFRAYSQAYRLKPSEKLSIQLEYLRRRIAVQKGEGL